MKVSKLCKLILHEKGKSVKSISSPVQGEIVMIEIVKKMRHERLPADLIPRIDAMYGTVGRLLSDTLEKWRVGFQYDTNIYREVTLWEEIEKSMLNYLADNPDADQRVALATFCRLSSCSEERTPLRRYWKGKSRPLLFQNERRQMIKKVWKEEPGDGQNRIS